MDLVFTYAHNPPRLRTPPLKGEGFNALGKAKVCKFPPLRGMPTAGGYVLQSKKIGELQPFAPPTSYKLQATSRRRHIMLTRLGYKLEPRTPAAHTVFFYTLGAIIFSLIVTGFIFMAYGLNPFAAYGTIIDKTILNWRGFSEVLRKSIPLLLCGVGLVLAFRAQFWNIGAEGQILAGATAAAGAALFIPIPALLRIPALFSAGFIGGGLWGFIPAILKIRLGVNEIITTLMMNYIMLYVVRWLINGPWKGSSARGFPESEPFCKRVYSSYYRANAPALADAAHCRPVGHFPRFFALTHEARL